MTLFDYLLDFLMILTFISLLLAGLASLAECIAICRGEVPENDDDEED